MNKVYTFLLLSICMQLSADQKKETPQHSNNKTTNQCANKKNTAQKLPAQKIKISKQEQKDQEQWKAFLKSCFTSVLTGATTGILSGQAFAYTVRHQCNYENKYARNFSKILSWFLWNAIRQTSLDMIEEEMDEYKIKHNTTLMTVAGFCADWLSWCYASNR